MPERTEDVQAHWTRPGALARIDAALTELGHDPQNLTPEILASLEHLHSGGLATTRDQAPTLKAMSSSLTPASAASRIWARLSFRAGLVPPFKSALSSLRSYWVNVTR
jgi:hypothetical protein